MKNIPRIYIDQIIEPGKHVSVSQEIVHYLRHVMRQISCLIFNSGIEYNAELLEDNKTLLVKEKTDHVDPSNDVVFYFAPIKKTDELINMVTQLGVAVLQPVITDRTVANHVNWQRIQKIIIEACEQSNRNSIPQLLSPIKFDDLDFSDLVVADERFAHDKQKTKDVSKTKKVFVGPEGGFSPREFEKMDSEHVKTLSLGKTILRAEVAGVVAVSKVLEQ